MKDEKPAELRKKSVTELEEMLQQERVALYVGRRDLVFRRTSDTTGMRTRRHNIARILTLMTQKKREESK
ncbi:MAG: 50S ribosomal protein L29 [Fimbriimonadaceae bacterium]